MKLRELLEKRAAALAAWKAIVTKAETETRDLSADEEKREGELKTEIADFDKKIERAEQLQQAERSAPAILRHGNLGDGTFEERAREFSITTAIRAAMGEPVDNGRERELSAELSRRTARSFQGIAVPDEAFAPLERRVMLASGAAAPLVPTQLLADQFIDRLRPSVLLPQLGATVLDGLVGDVDVPRQTASATTQWLAEDDALNASDLSFDDLQLRPKTVGALTSYSRRTMLNATPSIEALVRNDLSRAIAEAIDSAALQGDGTGNTPMGIAGNPNVILIDFTHGTKWARTLDMIASVEAANANGPSLAWVMSAYAAKTLRSTTKAPSDAAGGWIMDGPNELAGFRAFISSLAGGDPDASPPDYSAQIFFGNWQDLVLASWTGVDLLVNPYADSAYSRGRVLVRAMRDVDVGVRHPESFAVADLFVNASG